MGSMDSDFVPITTTFDLYTGYAMPAVGLGTHRITGQETVLTVVDQALAAGYRLFDTAPIYNNEAHLKKAFDVLLPKYGLDRHDIFITTKIYLSAQCNETAIKTSCARSLVNLGMDYIDLFVIRFPEVSKMEDCGREHMALQKKLWPSVIELYESGLVNTIGVSNMSVKQMKHLIQNYPDATPAVNQVEWNPFNYNQNLLHYCKRNSIVLQAYSSLGGPGSSLLNHRSVRELAKKSEVTNSQILLAWALQQDVAVIPKSCQPDHIKQNIALNFTLPSTAVRILNNISAPKPEPTHCEVKFVHRGCSKRYLKC